MAGIILGALGGAGGALQDIGSTLMKEDIAAKARAQESDLALERAKTLEVFKNTLATQTRDAPLQRMQGIIAKAREVEVPQEAAPVTEFSGRGTRPDGMPLETSGITGDVRKEIANVQAWPDSNPDKAPILAQLKRQLQTDQQAAQDAVAGQTRRRTKDEALAAASEEAMATDLPAYAAYEKEVGKPLRDERRVDAQVQREDTRAAQAAAAEARKAEQDARRWALDLQKLELQQASLDMQNRKVDALIDKWEADANKDTSKPERLYSIVNAMNQTIRNLNESSKGNTPEAKAEWQRQLDTAVRVRDRASQLLDANMGERGGAPVAAPPAAPASAPKPANRPPLSSFQR